MEKIAPSPTRSPRQVLAHKGDCLFRLDHLENGLHHFEWSLPAEASAIGRPIQTTPQVDRLPPLTTKEPALKLELDARTLALSVESMLSFELKDLNQPGRGLDVRVAEAHHVYGLGQQFQLLGEPNGDWLGRKRSPGNKFGNEQTEFHGGFNPNTQIPVAYVVTAGGCFALFLDHLYAQTWDLREATWSIESEGQSLRGFLITGRDLRELRERYMSLTGRPPVPPKKIFGFWISEWGYDDWNEVEDKLRTLNEERFPVDGAYLDLPWFGGIDGNSEKSRMGCLDWNIEKFPDPQRKIAELEERFGAGLIPIEESYVAKGLPEHEVLEERGYLARESEHGPATYLKGNPWWGLGGMIDWTNPEAGAFWHDWKRQPLIDAGVTGHWTDLGEPELFNDWAWYHGFPEHGKHAHKDIHNVYNFKWCESIFESYRRRRPDKRPYCLSRSGASGIQRLGVALWSADIASRAENLRSHFNAQMHVAMSGIDYYGSDSGGFYRDSYQGTSYGELYTQWLANSCAFDIPLRVHAKNVTKEFETAPDRNGHIASNLSNLRQRYELTPYYYSLAHRAHRFGEPIIAPVFYHYPSAETHAMGSQKLIGKDLLVVAFCEEGAKTADVYLPPGEWFDVFSLELIESAGEWVRHVPLYRDGLFKLPAFARAGAILPRMHVDEQTMNVMGKRRDGTKRDELILRIFPSAEPTSFTLFEDDGVSTGYLEGEVATTQIRQELSKDEWKIRVAPAIGGYRGMAESRALLLELVAPCAISEVRMGGAPLPRESWSVREGTLYIRTAATSVREGRSFTIRCM